MNVDLSLEFLRVVEQAAVASAHTMGQGNWRQSDRAAVEAMRRVMDTVPIDGTIVIGEGERDEAPMLYISQMGIADPGRVFRAADLASGEEIAFAATGVTDGPLFRGVRFFGDGVRTSSLVMQTRPHTIRFIDSVHVKDAQDVRIRF